MFRARKKFMNAKSFKQILGPDSGADVILYKKFFEEPVAQRLFKTLFAETEWQQERITIFGKTMPIPRLTAWCGEPGKTYTYSGIRVESSPWTDALLEIKTRIEEESETTFNSVLLNYYRHGRDSVAWHADDEKELGKNPAIGSVSFGAMRAFEMKPKHKTRASEKLSVPLEDGDYLLMRGATQHNWLHQIPKVKAAATGVDQTELLSQTSEPVERINLTFRRIIDWADIA